MSISPPKDNECLFKPKCKIIYGSPNVLIVGVSPPPGAILVLHSLPLEFPLAMAFAEQLLTWKLGESSERSEDELDTVPSSVLLQVVELLGRSHTS